ncbi:MAG: UDP-N-acetylmuramoyl-tripeptide--D-alanyl-D-alanine ligase [Anaerolineales bacterium]|nr:UDP-N-acetylmuramoyl-tripeptide--D-alanyl-D-alanine ligase [Anaerolineales bacterium]
MLRLADVVEALTGQRPATETHVITQAVIDSRTTIPGCLFVALKGERVDGHDFIGHAFDQGADFALVEKDMSAKFRQLDLRLPLPEDGLEGLDLPVCLRVENTLNALQEAARFWRNKLDVKVIGITGSVGKSTTKEMIAGVLSYRYPTHKNEGNYNNEIGLPLTILNLTEGHRRAVLEMGFYVPGEISFLCEIARPSIGVITNIGTVHAERAGSQEEIAAGKSELVQALPEDGVAILNYDDPWVRPMAQMTAARVMYYGLEPHADVWADQIEGLGLEGIRFRLHYGNEVLHLRVPMLGRHSVHTALRASAVGLAEGLAWEEIISGLRSGHMQLRLMVVRSASGALLVDDTYNASPQSTMAALNLLEELDGRKIAVLGDMLELGQYERQGHEMIGIRSAEVADVLITVGQRARVIARAAREAGLDNAYITSVENTQLATEVLAEIIGPEDVVLIKGSRGMQMDTIAPALEMKHE